MNLIIRAAQIANEAHAGQRRKYSEAAYITHPMRVAGRVMLMDAPREEAVAAAWLHDVIEDTAWTREKLLMHGIPAETVRIVEELTNPSVKFPYLNRAARKTMDRQHIAEASFWARAIKVIDRIDNLNEMGTEDGFARIYAQESALLMDAVAERSQERPMEGLLQELDEAIVTLESLLLP